jgi:multidrug efflux pump subunit AcrB
VPQLFADLEREKAKAQGVAVTDVFETMQAYLGSLYVRPTSWSPRSYKASLRRQNAQC